MRRTNTSESMKKRWQDPDYRDRMTEAFRARAQEHYFRGWRSRRLEQMRELEKRLARMTGRGT
jgi:hypothetical protein